MKKKADERSAVKERTTEILERLAERGYTYTKGNVYWDDNGVQVLLATSLKVVGRAETDTGAIDGAIVRIGPKGARLHCHVPHQALQEGSQLARVLATRGVVLPLEVRRQRALTVFIHELAAVAVCRLLSRDGVHEIQTATGSFFVAAFGGKVFVPQDQHFVAVRAHATESHCTGDLETWKIEMKSVLGANPLVLYAVLVGVSAPMVPLFGRPSPSAAYTGKSGTGKSTVAKLVRGLSGDPHRISRWQGTPSGIEALVAANCDSTTVMDELGTASPADLGALLYRVSEGDGTARATSTGELRQQAVIRCSMFATGEVTKAEHMRGREAGLRDGQEARLPTIRVSEDHGVISVIPEGFASSGQVVDHMLRVSVGNAGVVFPAFVELLIEKQRSLAEKMPQKAAAYEKELIELIEPGELSYVEQRVLNTMVTAMMAGTIAAQFGILPVSRSQVRDAVVHVYRLWIEEWREGTGRGADRHLQAIRAWFQKHARSSLCDLAEWDTSASRGCLGYVHAHRKHGALFLIRINAMRDEICKNMDMDGVLDSLDAAGLLAKQSKGRQWLQRMPGVAKDASASRMRFVAIRSEILFDQ